MKIYSYNNGSKSAKALAEALGCKLIRHEGNVLNVKNQTIINWGCSSDTANWRDMVKIGNIINHPNAVRKAVNKLSALQAMKEGVSVPEFTESREDAIKWLHGESIIVVRKKLNGHSGDGIQIIGLEDDVDVPEAHLYTKYIPKEHEWRVHVFQGEVFFVQRKARKLDVEDDNVNWKVRNLAGGFIYANQNIVAPENVQKEAKAAIMALGLDFGAVDVITKKNGKAYVLEVNTACGLMNSTLDAYVEQFKKLED